MKLVSLKARVLAGAVLWTIGLFTVAAIFIAALHEKSGFRPQASDRGSFIGVIHSAAGHATLTAAIAALCMVLGFLQVRRGLAPINQLRKRVAAVHGGVDTLVRGNYPAEVQPLVDELNALLEDRERRVARAAAKAGDLAHGLKTPLAVLMHVAQQVRASGHEQLAEDLQQQIDRMRRQVDYQLAHARLAASSASPAARTSIAASAEGIARVLQCLHTGDGVHIEIDAHASEAFRGQREDLDEMLGNLLDNACKWARARVKLTCAKEGQQVVILVDDDGPGIEPSMREDILRRGVRADEAAPGSGLGLAIVRDLAQAYGGSISLEESSLGGARARLTLPAPHHEP